MHEKNKSRKEFHMKRILTIALALVMLVSVISLFACAQGTDSKTTTVGGDTANPTTNNNDYDHALDSKDFGGQEITFVFAEGANDNFTQRSIKVEEEGGNEVNKKIMERNEYVERTLNISIVSQQADGGIADLRGTVENSLAAGSGDYDVITGYQYFDIGLALEGWLVNLNRPELYGIDGILDLTKGYWAQYYNENLRAGAGDNAARYWITGDLSLRYIGGMYVTYVNQRIYDDIIKPIDGDIYDIAFNGQWTLDKLAEFASKCWVDNGDVPEQPDKGDQLGFIWESGNDNIDGLAFGSQIPFSTKYADGSIKITLNDNRTTSFLQKIDPLFHSNYSYCETEGDDSRVRMQQFASGNVAFVIGHIKHAEMWLTEMTDGYYILPTPKLNEEQADYVTGVHDGCSIFGIAWDSNNKEAAACALEIMAAKSLELVTPTYYESAVKFKYTRDSNSAIVIENLVRKHVETDFAAVWSNNISDVAHFFRSNNTSKGISNTIKRSVTSYQAKLDELVEKFAQLREDENELAA